MKAQEGKTRRSPRRGLTLCPLEWIAVFCITENPSKPARFTTTLHRLHPCRSPCRRVQAMTLPVSEQGVKPMECRSLFQSRPKKLIVKTMPSQHQSHHRENHSYDSLLTTIKVTHVAATRLRMGYRQACDGCRCRHATCPSPPPPASPVRCPAWLKRYFHCPFR